MNISADTLCFLAVAALFILFVLPRLMNIMGGATQGNYPGNYPQGNPPNNNGTLDGNIRPTYDDPDVESRGSIGRDSGRSSSSGGGIFGNVTRPSGRSNSSGGGGIFRTPSSSSRSTVSSSSSRRDSPDIESRGGIGRDRD